MKKFETLEQAMAHIADQDKTIADLTKTVEASLAEVGELASKLDLQEKHKGDNIVTIGKKNYKLLGNRFFVDGQEVDADNLMKNKTELERMVKIKSGSLIELED